MKRTEKSAARAIVMAAVSGSLLIGAGSGCKREEAAPAPAGPGAVSAVPAAQQPVIDAAPPQPQDPTAVLVEVNGKKLAIGESDRQIMRSLAMSNRQVPPEQMQAMLPRFRKQMIDQFIAQTLVSGEIAKRNITLPDEDVDREIEKIRTQGRLPAGMTLEQALERQGITMGEFRTNVTTVLKANKLVEEPTAEEIAAFYEQEKENFETPEKARARHILVKVDETETPEQKAEKKAKAEALRKQIDEGADFAKLAAENSDCPSKDKGGELPPFGRGQMVKPFEDAAFSQATNTVGPVVESQFGYHIIEVLERHSAKTAPLEEVKDQIANQLRQQKLQPLLADLRAKADIQYHPDYAPPKPGQPPAGPGRPPAGPDAALSPPPPPPPGE